jgi:hypothetical protein
MAKVWEFSRHAGSELLMLLAIADFSDDEGRAYPAVSTLARKARMSPRNVNHILTALRASGELEVKANEGPHGTNRYRIRLDGISPLKPASALKRTSAPEAAFTPEEQFTLKPASSTPEAGFPQPLKPASAKPSLNHQEPSKRARKRTTPSGLTFSEWYAEAQRQERVFEPTDAVYEYQEKVGLPIEFVRLGWVVFMAIHKTNDKRQADWKATFRNYVKNGWLRLWYADNVSGKFALTTAGVQAAREHDRHELVGSP